MRSTRLQWRVLVALAAGMIVCFARHAEGQTCLGRPSFRDGMFQAVGRINKIVDGATSKRAGILIGNRNVLAGISYTASEPGFFRHVLSYQFGVAIERRLGVCPVFEVSTIGGSDKADTYVTNGYSAELGIFVGATAFETEQLKVIPTIGYRLYRFDLDFDLRRTPVNPDQLLGSTSHLIQGGVGLVFHRRFGATVSVTQNLSEADAKPVIVIGAFVQFGG